MIRVRITTPERTTLTEAGHVDVALYGNDDKIQIMVTMGVYFYEAHLVALDEAAKKEMPNTFCKIEMALRQPQPCIEIEVFQMGQTWVFGMMNGKYGVTIGKTETLVVSA